MAVRQAQRIACIAGKPGSYRSQGHHKPVGARLARDNGTSDAPHCLHRRQAWFLQKQCQLLLLV
ncbi:hypothetical protein C4K12_5204 [Pseudomonas chlororaphis subsp. aureofaciens]|nr:hypothetical protein C4K12_5204 [Pseudomonas chlororaphis subsp. aureofaciens]